MVQYEYHFMINCKSVFPMVDKSMISVFWKFLEIIGNFKKIGIDSAYLEKPLPTVQYFVPSA